MTKMNELSLLLDSLIDSCNKLIDVAECLKEYFSSTTETVSTPAKQDETPKAPEPEPAAAISFSDLRGMLATKSTLENGKYKSQVKELVAKYSTTGTLKGVPEESFEALMKEAEVIGNA